MSACACECARGSRQDTASLKRQLAVRYVAGSVCNYSTGSWKSRGTPGPSDVAALDETHMTSPCTAPVRHNI